MENTGFYVIPNKTQYEIGERVWLEIKKTCLLYTSDAADEL